MQEILLARQPIYNPRFQVQGFELFYRHARAGHAGPDDSDDSAIRAVLNVLAETDLGNVVGDRLAFINVSRRFILGGEPDALTCALALPGRQLVFEIGGDTAVDEPLLNALRALARQGRRFALDDYKDTPAGRALLEVAGIVKIDLLNTPPAEVRRLAGELRGRVTLAAECIETETALSLSRDLEFDLYQGHHFSRPRLIRMRSLPVHQAALLQLVGRLNDPAVDLAAIDTLIAQDVSLSYKLLRHINSAYFNLPRQVDSIHRAVRLLGLANVRAWATLIALSTLNPARGDLAMNALVRAKMCERLAGDGELAASGFTVGLLSALDAMTQTPLEEVLSELPLADDVNAALLRHEGPLGRILACVLAYEQGDWAAVDAAGIDPDRVSDAYFAALADAYRSAFEQL
ncbi:MAG: HDOD domain-containing protein [Pseudomonadota bacterium]|nr:HDOD domain-containing protein [Pseudomonadota bacterium]